MFTGIIEELGTVETVKSGNITIKCSKVTEDAEIGDSISVDGVCLTVTKFSENGFSADISQETRNVSTLSSLRCGDKVNLERALTLSERIGGHIVSGHIDAVGKIVEIKQDGEFYNVAFELPSEYEKYVIRKGSIAVNGISLTVADVSENRIKTAVIPHTFSNTSLSVANVGDYVNLEFDIISKYVEKFLLSKDNSTVTFDLLAKSGFC